MVLLGPVVAYLYRKLSNCYLKWLYYFAFPSENCKSSSCSSSLSVLSIVTIYLDLLDFFHRSFVVSSYRSYIYIFLKLYIFHLLVLI